MYGTHAKIKRCLSCCPLYGGRPHLGGSVKGGSTVHVCVCVEPYMCMRVYACVCVSYIHVHMYERVHCTCTCTRLYC